MSDSTSSPYVHLHPISPSSSLSSTDSAPLSEPTSDEQPDLGAFTTVLREWTHLQPPPRIPVQIRSATSSTTPTFQPEQSVIGSDFPSRSGRSRNSRVSFRSGLSGISSFTRPPSSSLHPEGSTVWNHAPIALYLNSGTPSNDVISEDEEEYQIRGEDEYTPSPPDSPASTSLTVEIASEVDFPSFDGSHDSNRIHLDSSPYPYHTDPGISLAVPLESHIQRLDSRETGHPEDEIEEGLRPSSDEVLGDGSSRTSRDFGRPGIVGGSYLIPSSHPQSHSHDQSQAGSNITSVQLQSQARPPTTAASSSDSLSLPILVSTTLATIPILPSAQASNSSNNDATSVNSSTSNSTLINASRTRSWNPLPPRATSDSSFMTGSLSSSNLSLLSYQIPETPPITAGEESDLDQGPNQAFSSLRAQPARSQLAANQFASSSSSLPSTSAASGSISLKTQQSLYSSNFGSVSHSISTFATQRQPPLLRPFNSPGIPQVSPLPSNGSPLPNPHSPLPQERELPSGVETGMRLPVANGRSYITMREFGVVNDLGTPDQPPSETLLFEPPQETRPEFLPVDDDEDEEMRIESKPVLHRFGRPDGPSVKAETLQTSGYSSSYDRPGPSLGRGRPEHRQLVSGRAVYLEPQCEGDDDDDDDDDYPYQYPFSHTPRSHAQAMTPRGIPPQTEPSGLTAFPQAQFVQLGPSQSLSQSQSQTQISQNTLVQHDPQVQQPSRPPVQSQPHSQTYLPTRTNMQTQTEALPVAQTQPPKPYPFGHTPAQSSTIRLYPSAQSTSFTQTQELANGKHGYRHSLLGLHALPTSLVSPEPEDLPGFEAAIVPLIALAAPPLVETDSVGDTLHLEEISEQPLPSLGYLDEALSFIASERARWSAARPSTSGTAGAHGPSDSREVGGGGSGEEGEGQDGEAEWKQTIENDQDHPKRKRRRKRPPRSHALPPGAVAGGVVDSPPTASKVEATADDSTSAHITSGSSPKRKKRSKSASASTSAHSILLESPSKIKPKSKVQEKEFLVLPPLTSSQADRSTNEKEKEKPLVTILRRPVILQPTQVTSEEVDVDLNDDGARTPTNSGDVVGGKASEVSQDGVPLNLSGKKGKRVGRREREREKLKMDMEKERTSEKGEDRDDGIAGEDFDIEIDYDDDDDDNVDDGVEPQEEDDDDHGENDSLSNMSLLQPPRRKRDRSRRRKGKDTAHIHSLIGIGGVGAYKSTPTTPRKFKFGSGHGVDDEVEEEDVGLEVKVEGEHVAEDDVFVSKPNEAANGEKKKRTRTKRKALSHARSDPELRLDAVLGGTVAVGDDSADATLAKPRKGKDKTQTEDAIDILDMDRNQLQKHLSAISGSGSGLLSTSRPTEARAQPLPESKRGRLLTLAKKLSQFFPEQRDEIGRVFARIERQGAAPTTKAKKALSADPSLDYGLAKSSPIPVPGAKRRKSRKGGHIRTGSEGTGGEAFEFDDDIVEDEHIPRGELVRFSGIEDEDEEEEIDPRGRPPKKGDVLIHVFIDHSNILIGLLSHLKRHPPQRSKITAATTRGRPLPTVLTKTTTAAKANDKSDPASAFAAVKSTSARPLPIPATGETSSGFSLTRPQPVPMQKSGNHPIPLPSFATMSRSLPTGSVLGTYMSGRDSGRLSDETTNKHEKEANSDGYEHPTMGNEAVDTVGSGSLFVGSFKNSKQKKPPKHLWHAALTLILERGRPITRRVVVTSSPLYQPMDSIERLGYELRVFIRVPDLGDGMDREKHRDKDRSGSGKSSGGGKSAQSSPVTTTLLSGSTLSAKRGRSIGHVRQISGNTSTESGSGGGAGPGKASGGGSAHPYNGITNGNTPQAKVKYREQGVDELLQLKLHQALAATDEVPEGSTIVLATGDGNMGQFNEDGFLGPVRTALRRGWKVELYAWEDGLSRAWRREFGAGSEWGRKGMFQVIGMEQFASSLVEASGWS